jgi:hypothetical protein
MLPVQEENAKLKAGEQLIRDKAKGLKLAQQIQEINGYSFAVQVDLNPEEAKT